MNTNQVTDLELLHNWHICLDFNLKPGDIVVVAGAYEGNVMRLLLELYPGIRIIGFDPQVWAIDRAVSKLGIKAEWDWTLLPYGLGTEDKTVNIYNYETDAATLFDPINNKPIGRGQIKEFSRVMQGLELDHIDLLVLNMEGYEFELVPYLYTNDWLGHIDKLCIQWHIGLDQFEDMESVNDLIENFIEDIGYTRIYDMRPTWTFHAQSNKMLST